MCWIHLIIVGMVVEKGLGNEKTGGQRMSSLHPHTTTVYSPLYQSVYPCAEQGNIYLSLAQVPITLLVEEVYASPVS